MGAVISLGAGWLAGWLAGWPAGWLASSESPRTSQAINLHLVMQLLIEEHHVKPQDYKNSCSEFGKVSLSCEGTLKQQTVQSGVYFLPQGSGDDFSANFSFSSEKWIDQLLKNITKNQLYNQLYSYNNYCYNYYCSRAISI